MLSCFAVEAKDGVAASLRGAKTDSLFISGLWRHRSDLPAGGAASREEHRVIRTPGRHLRGSDCVETDAFPSVERGRRRALLRIFGDSHPDRRVMSRMGFAHVWKGLRIPAESWLPGSPRASKHGVQPFHSAVSKPNSQSLDGPASERRVANFGIIPAFAFARDIDACGLPKE